MQIVRREGTMNRFRDLRVYSKALALTKDIRSTTKSFSREENFVLSSRFRRAGDSIVLNIAEGAGSDSDRDFSRFLNIAIRSAFECMGCLDIARVNDLMANAEYNDLDRRTNEIVAMLHSLKKSRQRGKVSD
jgi:four helix bundle protein